MDDKPTPRQSGTAAFWSTESEKLAVRLDALAIELLSDDRGADAGEAHCLADRLRSLAVAAAEWAYLERDSPTRVEQMNDIIVAHRRAHEMLTRSGVR